VKRLILLSVCVFLVFLSIPVQVTPKHSSTPILLGLGVIQIDWNFAEADSFIDSIAEDSSDIYLANGAYRNNAAINCGTNEGDVYSPAGLRFSQIGIAQGRTIDSAFLYCRTSVDAVSGVLCMIKNEAADNAVIWTSAAVLVDRSLGDSVLWTNVAQTTGTWYKSPNIKTLVQSVVSRVGFSSGNAIAIQMLSRGGTDDYVAYYSRLNGVASAPRIIIYHSAAGGSTPKGKRRKLMQLGETDTTDSISTLYRFAQEHER